MLFALTEEVRNLLASAAPCGSAIEIQFAGLSRILYEGDTLKTQSPGYVTRCIKTPRRDGRRLGSAVTNECKGSKHSAIEIPISRECRLESLSYRVFLHGGCGGGRLRCRAKPKLQARPVWTKWRHAMGRCIGRCIEWGFFHWPGRLANRSV